MTSSPPPPGPPTMPFTIFADSQNIYRSFWPPRAIGFIADIAVTASIIIMLFLANAKSERDAASRYYSPRFFFAAVTR